MAYVTLTDEELALLDGKVSEKVQVEVDAAKARLAARAELSGLNEKQAGFVADVVSEAATNGFLRFQWKPLSYCKVCSKSGGYAKYKSGPNRGLDNWKKPLYLNGVELADRFVTIQGRATVGCCKECFDIVKPYLKAKLEDMQVELSKPLLGQLGMEGDPKWKKWPKARCKKCGWEGHEGELRNIPAVMGGYYKGGCPACEAENKPLAFDRPVETDSKQHVVVPYAEFPPPPVSRY